MNSSLLSQHQLILTLSIEIAIFQPLTILPFNSLAPSLPHLLDPIPSHPILCSQSLEASPESGSGAVRPPCLHRHSGPHPSQRPPAVRGENGWVPQQDSGEGLIPKNAPAYILSLLGTFYRHIGEARCTETWNLLEGLFGPDEDGRDGCDVAPHHWS